MAFTKTVDYVQNIPVSLGYSSEVSGITGTVTARITYDGKGGILNIGQYGASESFLYSDAIQPVFANIWEIEGNQTDVNLALDALIWTPKAYTDAAIEQDDLSVDRQVIDYRGEVLIEVSDRLTKFAFNVGDIFKISHSGIISVYTTTSIETTLSGKRIYGTYNNDYDVSDLYESSDYKSIPLYDSILTDDGDVLIDNIVDYAIVDPHGTYELDVVILDDGSLHSNETTTLQGEFAVSEPFFSVAPPNQISTDGQDQWSGPFTFGEVAQDDDAPISVQLLMKRSGNDPNFDGNLNDNKPSYINDETYGVFNGIQVDDISSISYSSGEVRWQFTGTPAQCTVALSNIKFYQPSSNATNFFIEVRIVDDQARIYHNRGYA